MKAVIQNRYGGPETLSLVEVDKPSIKENDVLVQIKATNIASGDRRINTFDVPFLLKPIMGLLFGFKKPRRQIRGISASGIVEEVGQNVTIYKKGDRVYFINSMKAGCLAEYIALPEKAVMAPIPKEMSFQEAAPLAFGALSAYHFTNQDTIKPNTQVLIYGASGSVGSYALQFAKYYGASVTAVSSLKNHKVLKELGADHVIDYKTTDFRQEKVMYDVVFDAVGFLSKSSCKNVIKPGGQFLSVKSITKEDRNRLLKINEIVDQNGLKTLLDTVYPLTEYREAHAKTYTGHKVGNVVIDVTQT